MKIADVDCFYKKFNNESKEKFEYVVCGGIRFVGRLV